MAACCHKKAVLLFLLLNVITIKAHQEFLSQIEPDSNYQDASNENDIETAHDRLAREHDEIARRSQAAKTSGQPAYEYEEGLNIDMPGRRRNELTTITEASINTTVDPPLHPRYRRIYNPDESASVQEFPFMAALLVNKHLWCGAVVLASDRILSAAHCLQLQYNNRFFREYVKMLTVRVGSTNATAGGEVLRVTEIAFHPNYKPDTLEFNAAILRLHKNITFGKREPFVEKIDYSRDRNVPMDHNITFLGWGSVLGSGGIGGSVLLQKLELPVYDLADCQEVYGKDLVTRSNFCAGFITVAKNVCNHDAGGPAILDGVLTGILSFSSKRCDTPDQPAVFTTLGALAPWIEESMTDRQRAM